MSNDNVKVAVIGAGLVGSSWAIVFARAGFKTNIFDPESKTSKDVLKSIRSRLITMSDLGTGEDIEQILARITLCDSIKEALVDVKYIQESVFESVEVKSSVSLEIDKHMSTEAVVGSSSSGIPSSKFTQSCTNRNRFLIAHPVNPPHLHRLVEIVPASWTDKDALDSCAEILKKSGQITIHVKQELEGFIMNRLQGVLLNEAWALFEEGSASIEDIDKAVTFGLVPRWTVMGPFETIDLNAPGGIKDYAQRLGPLYHAIGRSRDGMPVWSEDLILKVERERNKILPRGDLKARCEWRDEQLIDYSQYKAQLEIKSS